MKIAMTSFALRNWDPDRSGTHIVGLSPEELTTRCNAALAAGSELVPGYAPFCKHLFLANDTDTRCGFSPITEDNRHLLRSGYVARRPGERAVLERWFEGLEAPRAAWLDVILYSHAQLVAEAADYPDEADVPDCDWGIVSIIATLVAREPPMLIRDGGVIAEGYDADLDELRNMSQNADQFLLDLEQRERERTGIQALKVSYNRVHGYYIEISKGQADKAPVEYVRRQTLKAAERYITPELKEFEDKVLGARERALAREKFLYEELLDKLHEVLGALQLCASGLAELDVLTCFAERAESLGLIRPEISATPCIEIEGGRHLVVEEVIEAPFIANDLSLDDNRRLLVITGPNMGGKSTYMRQTALIVILAHIGSFVPADRLKIGPIDRIYTRIGASDDLAGGRSTFMVEMTETATILNNATEHSLVLMDEIGRGTSTFDGLSLAWAAAHHMGEKARAFTLFATHYFELTALAQELPACGNVHLDATEHDGQLVFLHAVRPGPANQSYGLQVASLAGVPREVISRARAYLRVLESQQSRSQDELLQRQLDFSEPPPADDSALRGALEAIDPDSMTPREALDKLYELKKINDE